MVLTKGRRQALLDANSSGGNHEFAETLLSEGKHCRIQRTHTKLGTFGIGAVGPGLKEVQCHPIVQPP